MADWCPSPEERAIVIGIAVTFVYAIDAFANRKSAPPCQFSHQALPRAANPAFPPILPLRTLLSALLSPAAMRNALTRSIHLPRETGSALCCRVQSRPGVLSRLYGRHWSIQGFIRAGEAAGEEVRRSYEG